MARLGHGSREVRNWKMTPRRDAAGVWATGKPGSWPIGDLPHARLALVYAMSPSHANVRKRVLRSVAREYPDYDWAAYWDREVRQGRSSRKTKGRKGLKSWDQTLGAPARSRRRVAANPKRRRNSKSRWGSKTAPPLSSGVAWYPGHGPQAKGTDFRSWTNKKLLADGSAPARKELERRGRNPKTGKRRAWRNPRRRR